MNVLGMVQSLSLTAKQFQYIQTTLTHQNILNHAPIGCPYEDALAELLTNLRLGVILDKHTSWSRTTWLGGSFDGAPMLVV
ncbi:MAG: hypothetical protein ACFFCX_14670, partial [Candidatus Sifarchaeia archaeon]